MKKPVFLFFILTPLIFNCNGPKTEEASDNQEIASIITDPVAARIDSTLNSFVESGTIAGISALIYEKNQEVYFNAFGYADREAQKPMARNTLVRIYSMTKPITGTALMKLYEDNAFDLDDPVSKFAPEFEGQKVYVGDDDEGVMILEAPHRPLTIRDLTRHTAGFGNDGSLSAMVEEVDPLNWENDLTQMADKLGSIPLAFHPGEKWNYGPSVDVQAFLVERISGQPYGEFVREKVLDPLGMNETRYVIPENDRDRFAALYSRNDEGELSRIPDENANAFNYKKWPVTPGGFGLTSSLDDYMRFARMLVNEGELDGVRILNPETVELMSTNQLSDTITERSWLPSKGQVGFGIDFAVRLRPPASAEEMNGIVGEFFWDGAASTLFWVDPVNELTAVLFVQLMPFDRVGLHKSFKDAVYGKYQPNKNLTQ